MAVGVVNLVGWAYFVNGIDDNCGVLSPESSDDISILRVVKEECYLVIDGFGIFESRIEILPVQKDGF